MKPVLIVVVVTCASGLAWAQSGSKPTFEAVDVHPSVKSARQFVRTGPVRAGRYEIKAATMVDLIRIGYGFDSDKILGGPSWLEMDRFDLAGKVPAGATLESINLMLQAALEERFKLAVHKDTKALPTYVLTAGKQHRLKPASGDEEPGCRPPSAPAPAAGDGPRITLMTTVGGNPVTYILGPGMVIQYQCRNITMAGFAAALRSMFGANVGTNPVLDETGLTGSWNFDIRFSLTLIGPPMGDAAERIPLTDAVDKQLGLKLEERPNPTPVLVVDSVLRTPTPNAANIVELLPPVVPPTEFDVASVRMSDPTTRGGRFQTQTGRFVSQGMPLAFLIQRAFNSMSGEQIAGIPAFAQTARYDITATIPSAAGAPPATDFEVLGPMLISLLKDRFKLAYHTEDRPMTTYSLVQANPKLKKADPESRSWCKSPPPSPAAPPGSRVFACQNVTMAQFAERLQGLAQELVWPVEDATRLEGNWDLTLTFSFITAPPPGLPAVAGRGGGPGDLPTASDPTGAITIFDAIERQLGLRLERQKRLVPVIVIDHLEEKPTEN
jgi:uncharacterized protein (TIGR03435 family)